MTVSIAITGFKQVQRILDKSFKATKRNVNISMDKVGLFMQGEVKLSIAGRRAEPTSVDTGRFLNSVQYTVGNNFVTIFSEVPYSDFLEFGTTRIQARRHFNNSLDRNEKKVRNIINAEVRKL